MYRILILTAALSLPGLAGAAIYDVNRVIGAGGVTGFIETDGTFGAIGDTNIVDWSLTLSEGGDVITLLGPNSGANSGVMTSGSGVTATPTQLWFDFTAAADTWLLFQAPSIGSGMNSWCLETDQCTGNASSESVLVGSTGEISALRSGLELIGTRTADPVPEPSTWMLMMGGLAAIMLRRRSR